MQKGFHFWVELHSEPVGCVGMIGHIRVVRGPEGLHRRVEERYDHGGLGRGGGSHPPGYLPRFGPAYRAWRWSLGPAALGQVVVSREGFLGAEGSHEEPVVDQIVEVTAVGLGAWKD